MITFICVNYISITQRFNHVQDTNIEWRLVLDISTEQCLFNRLGVFKNRFVRFKLHIKTIHVLTYTRCQDNSHLHRHRKHDEYPARPRDRMQRNNSGCCTQLELSLTGDTAELKFTKGMSSNT